MVTNLNAIIVAENAVSLIISKAFTQHFPTGTILASTDNFEVGETLIHLHQPNLVLVEIALDNDNSMSLLNNLRPYHFEIMFISRTKTSQTKYFTYSSITCLTVPFEPEVMKYAFNKVYEKISHNSLLLPGNIELDMNLYHSMHQKLSIFDKGKTHLILMSNIAYLHSVNGYTDVFLNDKATYQSTKQIGDLIPFLPINIFCRIQKGYVVNIMSITAHFTKEGELFLQMKNNEMIPVSCTYKEGLLAMFSKSFV